ncbi:MAG TPA: hypothetical protein VE781_03545 [Kineosporiaceae bacterium]|jgi:hypothetical protein|nr:hypothetical protein [Kineosporiaceae bacterium]
MPAELRPDDEVTDWQYQWQGPDGAESWWPAMPFVHAQLYLTTLFPAFLVGLLLAWGFGTGLVSRVVPVVLCLGVTWLVVSEWLKHVDAVRPVAWHRAVLRSELRSPRPAPAGEVLVVTTTAEHLLDVPPVPGPRTEPGSEPWAGVLA